MPHLGALLMAAAQIATSTTSFEVATIRANLSGDRIMQYQPGRGGRFTATNCSLGLLIEYAYQVRQFQIAGAPDWVKSDRYDLAARAEGDPPIDQLRFLLQRLLADRFQLRQHWETREAAVYELVVSKPGKLKTSGPGDCSADETPCGGLRNTPGHTKGYKLTGGDVAGSLTFFLGRLVVDKTGLSGRYDFELEWTPDSVQMQSSPVESSAPSIFTAVQDQLGLKLKPAQGPVPTLVIDGVERPSGN